MESWTFQSATIVSNLYSSRFWNSCFSKSSDLISSLKVSLWNFSVLIDFWSKNIRFCSMHCNVDEPEETEVLSVSTCIDFPTPLSSTLPAYFFDQGVHRLFFTWDRLFVFSYHQICFFSMDLESSRSNIGKNPLLHKIGLSRRSNSFSGKPCGLFPRGDFPNLYFEMLDVQRLSSWTISNFCVLFLNSDRLRMQKKTIKFPAFQNSNSKMSRATGSKFFEEVFVNSFVSILMFSWNCLVVC